MNTDMIKKNTKYIFTFTMLLFLSSYAVPSLLANSFTRPNGINWIHFGPAVIDCCQRIEVRLGLGASPIVIRSNDAQFPVLRDWIRKHFSDELNRSPITHSYESVQYIYTIELYCSESGKYNHLLMEIPLTDTTLGKCGKAFIGEVDQLKNIVTSRGGQKAKTR
jgi:hypothetical protein